jgi:curved DNA-binding protein CbpA
VTLGDPYKTLGLPPGAGGEEIARAYRKLVRRYPPELAPREFARVQEAYGWLTSPARRMAAARTAPEEAIEALFPFPEIRLRPREEAAQPPALGDWEAKDWGAEDWEALGEELQAPLRRAALRRLLREAFSPPPSLPEPQP